MKYARQWTVLVARPDWMVENQARELCWTYVDARGPDEAAAEGVLSVILHDARDRGDTDASDVAEQMDSYFAVAVIPGTHEDWREG